MSFPVPVASGLAAKILALLASFATPVLLAQTADPSATPANTTTAAPAAKAGTYAVAQGEIVAAPGLVIPNGNLPWALDTAGGKSALVPIHHSAINETAGEGAQNAAAANAAQSGAAATTPGTASAPPQATHTLNGAHARTVLHSTEPVFYIHANDRTENTGDAGRGNPTGWVLVAATSSGGSRTFPHIRFSQVAGGTACTAPAVCVQAESLPDGWLRLSPKTPIQPGDYALLPVPRQPKPGVVIVYDFVVDPAAPMAKDAILPGQAPAPASKHKKH